jgi:hypothetical protein
MKLAFYKATHSGVPGVYNRLVRWWDQGPYSHCEMVFSDGMSASSSFMDKGVRFKQIVYNPDNWDFVDVPDAYEVAARQWFSARIGEGYDLLGNARFAFGFLESPEDKWFCSEAIAAALGVEEPWRVSPNGLTSFMRLLAAMDTRIVYQAAA